MVEADATQPGRAMATGDAVEIARAPAAASNRSGSSSYRGAWPKRGRAAALEPPVPLLPMPIAF